MLDLPDDCLLYLFNLNYPSFENIRSLFLTCTRLNLLSDVYINNVLKKDFKLIIRDNNLNNAKESYMLIYKIYGNIFTLDKSKLQFLAVQSLLTNNIELLELLYKTASNTLKSKMTVFALFRTALNIKSEFFINYLLEKNKIIDNELIAEIVSHYYINNIDLPEILKNIIDKNENYNEHKDDIVMNVCLKRKIYSLYLNHA